MRRRHRHPLDLRARVVERVRGRSTAAVDLGLDAVDVGQLLDDARPAARRRRVDGRERAARASAIDVESSGSWPQIASSSSAASSTVVANGPIWSSDDANAIRP